MQRNTDLENNRDLYEIDCMISLFLIAEERKCPAFNEISSALAMNLLREEPPLHSANDGPNGAYWKAKSGLTTIYYTHLDGFQIGQYLRLFFDGYLFI